MSLLLKHLCLLFVLLLPSLSFSLPPLSAAGYVLMDAHTGNVLTEKEAHRTLAPASLTKLMTLYLASEALAKGDIQLTDKVTVSEKAWKTPGSRMFMRFSSPVSTISFALSNK